MPHPQHPLIPNSATLWPRLGLSRGSEIPACGMPSEPRLSARWCARRRRNAYRAFCTAYGDPVQCGTTVAWLFPSPETVLKLYDDQFAEIGLAFKCHALRAAASAFFVHENTWERMPVGDLAAALCTVPGVGLWTAGATAADWSNHFSVYPCGDLAVRTWATHAAPSVSCPDTESAFQQHWRQHADPHLAELTLLTLAWEADMQGHQPLTRPSSRVPTPLGPSTPCSSTHRSGTMPFPPHQ